MEAGLSDRAVRVLRAVHEKACMDLAEMPDPALVADQLSLRELLRSDNSRGNTGLGSQPGI
jgi:hypothetical protein